MLVSSSLSTSALETTTRSAKIDTISRQVWDGRCTLADSDLTNHFSNCLKSISLARFPVFEFWMLPPSFCLWMMQKNLYRFQGDGWQELGLICHIFTVCFLFLNTMVRVDEKSLLLGRPGSSGILDIGVVVRHLQVRFLAILSSLPEFMSRLRWGDKCDTMTNDTILKHENKDSPITGACTSSLLDRLCLYHNGARSSFPLAYLFSGLKRKSPLLCKYKIVQYYQLYRLIRLLL